MIGSLFGILLLVVIWGSRFLTGVSSVPKGVGVFVTPEIIWSDPSMMFWRLAFLILLSKSQSRGKKKFPQKIYLRNLKVRSLCKLSKNDLGGRFSLRCLLARSVYKSSSYQLSLSAQISVRGLLARSWHKAPYKRSLCLGKISWRAPSWQHFCKRWLVLR